MEGEITKREREGENETEDEFIDIQDMSTMIMSLLSIRRHVETTGDILANAVEDYKSFSIGSAKQDAVRDHLGLSKSNMLLVLSNIDDALAVLHVSMKKNREMLIDEITKGHDEAVEEVLADLCRVSIKGDDDQMETYTKEVQKLCNTPEPPLQNVQAETNADTQA